MNYYEYLHEKDMLDEIREELAEIDRLCDESVSAKDYFEKCLHELAAFERFKENIRDIIK